MLKPFSRVSIDTHTHTHMHTDRHKLIDATKYTTHTTAIAVGTGNETQMQ